MGYQIQHPLVWIDCEMTGLDVDTDEIIEIYCLITDGNLNIVDKDGWGTVIHQSKERMDQMGEWCTFQHGKSGLTDAVISSNVTPEGAADALLAYIERFVPHPQTAILAGNSVHQDKAFLRKGPYKKVVDHLHYRILDVSTLSEAAKMWAPEVANSAPRKQALHQAREDIIESIDEAKYYKQSLFTTRRSTDSADTVGLGLDA